MKKIKNIVYIFSIIFIFALSNIVLATEENIDIPSDNPGNENEISQGDTQEENQGTNQENNTENSTVDNTENNTEEPENNNSESENEANQVNTENENNNVQEENANSNSLGQTESIQTSVTPESHTVTYVPISSSVNEKEKSKNANLKSLNIDLDGMTPEFSQNVTDYYLIVDLTIENVDVKALAEDSVAKVSITGNTDLEEGENTISIVVTAEAGNAKTYLIHVTKTNDEEATNANLKTLSIKGFNFYPGFKNNIYNYNLIITERKDSLEITAEAENDAATIEIIGNENLTEGDNLIKIIVTAKNGETKKEYKINAYISSKNVEGLKANKIQAFIILTILGISIITISILVIKRKV